MELFHDEIQKHILFIYLFSQIEISFGLGGLVVKYKDVKRTVDVLLNLDEDADRSCM